MSNDRPEGPSGEELRLIRAAQGGDTRAFESLVLPLLRELHSFAAGQVRSAPHIPVDEVVQDALVTGWQALDRYIEEYPFRSYIFGIAREIARRRLYTRERSVPTDWSSGGEGPIGEPPASSYAGVLGRVGDLIGHERFPCPDQRISATDRVRELLIAMLGYGGYPHQQMSFAYSIILWGRVGGRRAPVRDSRGGRKKVPIAGDPRRVVAELARAELQGLAGEFRGEVEVRLPITLEHLDEAFAPLEFRLGLLGRGLFARDQRSAKLFSRLAESVVGGTMLEAYFGSDPCKSVADWTDRVKERTRAALNGEIDPARSPLPWPPGHENQCART